MTQWIADNADEILVTIMFLLFMLSLLLLSAGLFGLNPINDDGSEPGVRSEEADKAEASSKSSSQMADSETLVRKLLEGDKGIAAELLELAGMPAGLSPRQAAQDDQTVQAIAQSVSLQSLTVLQHASSSVDQLDQIELRKSKRRSETPYRSDETELELMRSLGDLPNVDPADLAGDDTLFWQSTASQDFMVERHYEVEEEIPCVVVVIDVSGSMSLPMADSTMRYTWAAGVTYKMVLRTQSGGARLIIRYFDDKPYEGHVITTPEDARQMKSRLLRMTDTGKGTNIQAALEMAKLDIVQNANDIGASEVVLVTDGESNMDDQWVAENFGKQGNITLHLVSIGCTNDFLASIANTHETYQ